MEYGDILFISIHHELRHEYMIAIPVPPFCSAVDSEMLKSYLLQIILRWGLGTPTNCPQSKIAHTSGGNRT